MHPCTRVCPHNTVLKLSTCIVAPIETVVVHQDSVTPSATTVLTNILEIHSYEMAPLDGDTVLSELCSVSSTAPKSDSVSRGF